MYDGILYVSTSLTWILLLDSQELGHDPLHWMLQMDHNRQVHILPRTHTESDMDVAGAQAKVLSSLFAFYPIKLN